MIGDMNAHINDVRTKRDGKRNYARDDKRGDEVVDDTGVCRETVEAESLAPRWSDERRDKWRDSAVGHGKAISLEGLIIVGDRCKGGGRCFLPDKVPGAKREPTPPFEIRPQASYRRY